MKRRTVDGGTPDLPAAAARHPGRQAATVAAVAATGLSFAAYAHRRAQRPPWMPSAGRLVQTSSLSTRLLGSAGPPILLLHGLVASGLYWGRAYDGLADHHRLVVPDLLGFGRSPRPAAGYGPDDHAHAVIACLDDLGIRGPVVIGAHSLGTLIALRLAATHPGRVAAVVAYGPPLYADGREARAHVTATSPMGPLFVLPGQAARRACGWLCSHRRLAARLASLTHPGLPPEIAADAVQHTWSSYSQTLQEVILAAEASTWLDHISCPVTLVAGDHDPVVDLAHLRLLAATYDSVALRERPGRHDLPLTDPLGCAAVIGEAARGASYGRVETTPTP